MLPGKINRYHVKTSLILCLNMINIVAQHNLYKVLRDKYRVFYDKYHVFLYVFSANPHPHENGYISCFNIVNISFKHCLYFDLT